MTREFRLGDWLVEPDLNQARRAQIRIITRLYGNLFEEEIMTRFIGVHYSLYGTCGIDCLKIRR